MQDEANCENRSYNKIKIELDGQEYEPIPHNGDFRCHDCGAKKGQFHMAGCDCEICPICGGQIIACECFEE